MRIDKKLYRALIYISSEKTHAFVIESVYVVQGGGVVFRTQGGQWPNKAERAELQTLAKVLDQPLDELKRRIRACNTPQAPEPSPQVRLAVKRAERERMQKLMNMLHTWGKPREK